MSDRLAVFNRGRIEQVGAPAEVYERPATTFVAGFVGTSNLLGGEAARTILGEDGLFTVRPEKIHFADDDDAFDADEVSAQGRVAEVVYIGPDTRYIVALDAGAQLVVTQQNLTHVVQRGARGSGSQRPIGLETPSLPAHHRWAAGDGGGTTPMIPRKLFGVAASAALLIAACGGGTGGSPAPSTVTALGAGEGVVTTLNWAGYVEDGSTYPEYDWVTDFEKETGCDVQAQTLRHLGRGVRGDDREPGTVRRHLGLGRRRQAPWRRAAMSSP